VFAIASIKLGRARKFSKADETVLLEYLMAEGWRQQDEMVYWLWHERGALVSRSTVSRVLKCNCISTCNKWTRKEIRRISMDRSETAYLDDICRFVTENSTSRYSMRRLAGATTLILAMKRNIRISPENYGGIKVNTP
jgi:hypothetical protein